MPLGLVAYRFVVFVMYSPGATGPGWAEAGGGRCKRVATACLPLAACSLVPSRVPSRACLLPARAPFHKHLAAQGNDQIEFWEAIIMLCMYFGYVSHAKGPAGQAPSSEGECS